MSKEIQSQYTINKITLSNLYLVACAIILLIELASSFAVSTSESCNTKPSVAPQHTENSHTEGIV